MRNITDVNNWMVGYFKQYINIAEDYINSHNTVVVFDNNVKAKDQLSDMLTLCHDMIKQHIRPIVSNSLVSNIELTRDAMDMKQCADELLKKIHERLNEDEICL